MRLVRFLSSSGLCSRRNAAELIKNSHIMVNRSVCTDPAYLVTAKDTVTYKGKPVVVTTEMIYLVLNKPLDVICAASSPHDETTVVDLVEKAFPNARLYPIGRLDKDTSGLILLTNDGDLAFKLSHPKFEISKRYRVTLDRQLAYEDMDTLLDGVELEDGLTAFDAVFTNTPRKNAVDVVLHSGKNRIIRRMFGALNYKIVSLHRFAIDTLNLGSLRPGEFRKLSKDELDALKNASSAQD